MLRARQRSQLPGLQPAHGQRSASRLHQGRCVRGQSSRPEAGGVRTPRGGTVTRWLAPGRPTHARGLQGPGLHPLGCRGSVLQPGLWLTGASRWKGTLFTGQPPLADPDPGLAEEGGRAPPVHAATSLS